MIHTDIICNDSSLSKLKLENLLYGIESFRKGIGGFLLYIFRSQQLLLKYFLIRYSFNKTLYLQAIFASFGLLCKCDFKNSVEFIIVRLMHDLNWAGK